MSRKIILSSEDQILLLLRTAHNIEEMMHHLDRVEFNVDLSKYQKELAAINDIIADSCVKDLKTESEIEDEANEARGEREYRDQVRDMYYFQQMGM